MRLSRTQGLLITLLAVVASVVPVSGASADDSLMTTNDEIIATAKVKRDRAGQRAAVAKRTNVGPAARSEYRYLPKDQYKSQMSTYKKRLAAAIAANDAATNARGQCIATSTDFACNRFAQTALPEAPDIRQAGEPAGPAAPAAPALSPQEVAYIASARLQLAPPKPMIGPSPELNEWKMAAVGYPLWLWADGEVDPAPVSDSVADIAVSLDAHLVKVVFDMGDGNKISCSDLGTKWTPAVEPGAKSPSCGYAYEKPSLPAGSYTVTANAVWAIDWNINGTTGTIPLYQSASTAIPVGELQVLVR